MLDPKDTNQTNEEVNEELSTDELKGVSGGFSDQIELGVSSSPRMGKKLKTPKKGDTSWTEGVLRPLGKLNTNDLNTTFFTCFKTRKGVERLPTVLDCLQQVSTS